MVLHSFASRVFNFPPIALPPFPPVLMRSELCISGLDSASTFLIAARLGGVFILRL